MAEDIAVTGRKLRHSLVRVQGQVIKFWSIAAALDLRNVLASGQRTDGTAMPPLRRATIRIKKSKSLDLRVGVRRTNLMRSLKGASNIVSRHLAEIRGHNGSKDNSMKSRFLIFGRGPSDGKERTKGGRKIKGTKTKTAPRKDGGQVPRDFMGLKVKKGETIDRVAEVAMDLAWKKLGW